MMCRMIRSCVIALASLSLGCLPTLEDPEVDAGEDAAWDAGVDAAMDVGVDAAMDVDVCDDPICEGRRDGELIMCVAVSEDMDQPYSVCRSDKETGCLTFVIEYCASGLICVDADPFGEPCQSS